MSLCLDFPGPLGAMAVCHPETLSGMIIVYVPLILMMSAGLCVMSGKLVSRANDDSGGWDLLYTSDSSSSPAPARRTTKLVDGSALFEQMLQTTQAEMASCECYCPNMQAETFGTCICGQPRALHTAAALKAGTEFSTPKKVDESALRARMTRREKPGCSKYVPNLQAAQMGECVCGQARGEHTDAALQAGGEFVSPKRVDEDALRERMTKRETVDCNHYRPNLKALNFGECMCGKPRGEHTDLALIAGGVRTSPKAVDEDALRERMTKRETVDCNHYRPNMEAAAFGECVCGQPRAAHSSAALAGSASGSGSASASTEVKKDT